MQWCRLDRPTRMNSSAHQEICSGKELKDLQASKLKDLGLSWFVDSSKRLSTACCYVPACLLVAGSYIFSCCLVFPAYLRGQVNVAHNISIDVWQVWYVWPCIACNDSYIGRSCSISQDSSCFLYRAALSRTWCQWVGPIVQWLGAILGCHRWMAWLTCIAYDSPHRSRYEKQKTFTIWGLCWRSFVEKHET